MQVWHKIYKGTFGFAEIRRQINADIVSAIDQFNFDDPLMVEVFSPSHVGVLVVRGNHLWFGDRSLHPQMVITEYILKPEYENKPEELKNFVHQVFPLNIDYLVFSHIGNLISASYTFVKTIPFGTQRSANCFLQGWLMGLRFAFISMGIDHALYRRLTAEARKIVWAEASAQVETEKLLKLPMAMTHVMAIESQSPLSFDVTLNLLLQARNAFFYPYNHIHTFVPIIATTDSAIIDELVRKLTKLTDLRTNDDVIMKRIMDSSEEEGYHPYLRILAMCLLNQGEGVQSYLSTLQTNTQIMQEIHEYAQQPDFTLIHAIIYFADRHQIDIKSNNLVSIWELTFGEDWRNYRPGIMSIRHIPPIKLEENPSAKALFYAALTASKFDHISVSFFLKKYHRK